MVRYMRQGNYTQSQNPPTCLYASIRRPLSDRRKLILLADLDFIVLTIIKNRSRRTKTTEGRTR
jgi:hypothetical protein